MWLFSELTKNLMKLKLKVAFVEDIDRLQEVIREMVTLQRLETHIILSPGKLADVLSRQAPSIRKICNNSIFVDTCLLL